MFLRGDSAQGEILPKNMFVYSQIGIFICMFPRGNSAQVEIPPKNIPINFKFVPIHICFFEGRPAYVRVFPLKTYQYNHKLCIHIHVFPRGNSAQMESPTTDVFI